MSSIDSGGPLAAPVVAPMVSWGQRAIAALIDIVILGVVIGLVALALPVIGQTIAAAGNNAPAPEIGTVITILLFLGTAGVALLATALYFIFSWQIGQTIGQRLRRLRVVSASGAPVTAGQAVLRFVGAVVGTAIIGLGWLWPFWDSQRRGLHDIFAGTRVVSSQ